MTENEERLQRHVRAIGAVNRQLTAGLDSGAPAYGGLAGSTRTTAGRRASLTEAWLDQLAEAGRPEDVHLAQLPDGTVFLVEGSRKRIVKSGLLATALEADLGERRPATAEALSGLDEGPPVEVFEGASGPPFLVVGGQRCTLRGLPLPHQVNDRAVQNLPAGPELNLSAVAIARASLRRAVSRRSLADRYRRSVRRNGGTVGAATAFARKLAGRVKRSVKS
jgi:hypothetical protein